MLVLQILSTIVLIIVSFLALAFLELTFDDHELMTFLGLIFAVTLISISIWI